MRRNGPMMPSESDDQAGILHPLMDENRSDPRPSAIWLLVILVLGATGFGLGTVEATLATEWNLPYPFTGKVVLENISSKRCVDCCATLRSQPCACAFNQVAFVCTNHTCAACLPRKCGKLYFPLYFRRFHLWDPRHAHQEDGHRCTESTWHTHIHRYSTILSCIAFALSRSYII